MIESPYLLYLGSSSDEIGIKTSRGLAMFRPEDCVGEFRRPESPLTLGLKMLSFDEAAKAGARTLVLGIANAGGHMAEDMIEDSVLALAAGLNVASGLHSRLRDEPRIVEAARRCGRLLHDVRDPPLNLPVGNGRKRAGKRLLTVGTDCSVGKMVTTLCLEREMRARGIRADFRATGQTGILIAGAGVPLDAVIADFLSGAIEQLSPERTDGGWDLIEGQGSLFHPSFAGVSTGLLHGAQPDAVVLCHEPTRASMRGLPHFQLPTLEQTLEANLQVARLTNPAVRAVGVAINSSRLSRSEAEEVCAAISEQFNLPCVDPIADGTGPIIDRIEQGFATSPSVERSLS